MLLKQYRCVDLCTEWPALASAVLWILTIHFAGKSLYWGFSVISENYAYCNRAFRNQEEPFYKVSSSLINCRNTLKKTITRFKDILGCFERHKKEVIKYLTLLHLVFCPNAFRTQMLQDHENNIRATSAEPLTQSWP